MHPTPPVVNCLLSLSRNCSVNWYTSSRNWLVNLDVSVDFVEVKNMNCSSDLCINSSTALISGDPSTMWTQSLVFKGICWEDGNKNTRWYGIFYTDLHIACSVRCILFDMLLALGNGKQNLVVVKIISSFYCYWMWVSRCHYCRGGCFMAVSHSSEVSVSWLWGCVQ